jgi:hypothetical protein
MTKIIELFYFDQTKPINPMKNLIQTLKTEWQATNKLEFAMLIIMFVVLGLITYSCIYFVYSIF